MENFKIVKVKLLPALGVEIKYKEKVVREGEDYWLERIVKSQIQRHPDLDSSLDALKIHIVNIFGLLAVGMYKPLSDFADTELKLLEEIMADIEVLGISVSGNEAGIVISAKRKILNKKAVLNMNTHNIMFETSEYEYLSELEEEMDKVKEEAFEYIYKRKFAQLDLFHVEEMKIYDKSIEISNQLKSEKNANVL